VGPLPVLETTISSLEDTVARLRRENAQLRLTGLWLTELSGPVVIEDMDAEGAQLSLLDVHNMMFAMEVQGKVHQGALVDENHIRWADGEVWTRSSLVKAKQEFLAAKDAAGAAPASPKVPEANARSRDGRPPRTPRRVDKISKVAAQEETTTPQVNPAHPATNTGGTSQQPELPPVPRRGGNQFKPPANWVPEASPARTWVEEGPDQAPGQVQDETPVGSGCTGSGHAATQPLPPAEKKRGAGPGARGTPRRRETRSRTAGSGGNASPAVGYGALKAHFRSAVSSSGGTFADDTPETKTQAS